MQRPLPAEDVGALVAATHDYDRISAALDRAREDLYVEILRARDAGVSARRIAEVSGLTRQMVHLVLRERR